MSKIELDKYYTPTSLAKVLIDKTFAVIGESNIQSVVEPSAGSGSFSLQIENCFACDIAPEHDSVLQQDFLKLELGYEEGRLFIGNPPFGDRVNLFGQFIKKCMKEGDYIAFILPISQLNNNQRFYQFDLIYSQDLGYVDYSGVSVWCCFNIYKRPSDGIKRKPRKYKIKGVEVTEWRRGGTYPKPDSYDFGICSFGAGSFGKVIYQYDTFCQELWIKCEDKILSEKIERFLIDFNLKGYIKTTSKPKIQAWGLRKLLLDNFEELEEEIS